MDDAPDEKATKKCDSPDDNKNNCDDVKNVAHCISFIDDYTKLCQIK